MTDTPTTAPDPSPRLCAHCGQPITGKAIREWNGPAGNPARSWHADRPDCRATALRCGEECAEQHTYTGPCALTPDAELTADEARAEVERLAGELYQAQDRIDWVHELCDIADRNGTTTVPVARVRRWLEGPKCGRQMLAAAPDNVRDPADNSATGTTNPQAGTGAAEDNRADNAPDNCEHPHADHPGIRGLLEHVGIHTTGRAITVDGKVIDPAPEGEAVPHTCPTCSNPTVYKPYSGGREWFCEGCQETGEYPEGQAPRRAQMLQTLEGRTALRAEMRQELDRKRVSSGPAGGPKELATSAASPNETAASVGTREDRLRERVADALTKAAYDCDGNCGLSERECWDAHPITFSARIGGTTHVDGAVTAIADVVGGVRDREMEQMRESRENWKAGMIIAVRRAEQADAAIARVRALHRDEYGCCTACTGESAVPWPCDTIRALDCTGQPAAVPVEELARMLHAARWRPPLPWDRIIEPARDEYRREARELLEQLDITPREVDQTDTEGSGQ